MSLSWLGIFQIVLVNCRHLAASGVGVVGYFLSLQHFRKNNVSDKSGSGLACKASTPLVWPVVYVSELKSNVGSALNRWNATSWSQARNPASLCRSHARRNSVLDVDTWLEGRNFTKGTTGNMFSRQIYHLCWVNSPAASARDRHDDVLAVCFRSRPESIRTENVQGCTLPYFVCVSMFAESGPWPGWEKPFYCVNTGNSQVQENI